MNKEVVDWLEWDSVKMIGKYLNVPERIQIPENIQESCINFCGYTKKWWTEIL